MKKILLASTMLVATGSMAAAEVTLGGYGRFGLFYAETDVADQSSTRIEQRFRLDIQSLATTDGGVQFGARIRIEANEDGDGSVGNTSFGNGLGGVTGAPEFNVEAGGFRLDVGNTADVIDSGDVVDYYGYGIGLTSFLETSSGFALPVSGFGTGTDVVPTVKARYSVGDFTVAASYSDNANDTTDSEWQVGFGYVFSGYSAGIAFGSEEGGLTGDNDFVAASLGGSIGSADFSLLVADSDDQDDVSYGLSVRFPVGPSTDIHALVNDDGDDASDTAYGIGFRHNLGGGVSFRGGIAENNASNTVADLGVIFNF